MGYSEGFLTGSDYENKEIYEEAFLKGSNYSKEFGKILGQIE
jgi:hypothetical protein